MSPAPRVRIAPSPTGDPHVGTAYVALFNRTWARSQGGSFLLRIDDTDRSRYRPESEEAIYRALRWLGLDWDEGPDVGGPHRPYRQSERNEIYRQRCQELVDSKAAYPCFCTSERISALREEQKSRKERLGYDGHCRDLDPDEARVRREAGESHVIRLRVPTAGDTRFIDQLRGEIVVSNSEIDDQILMKSDGYPTYHLANVVDDIDFEISEVVRAEEWLISTPKHVLLYRAFEKPLPRFFHVPLLRNSDHSKISKRKNPVSLDWYREEGYLPEALLNFLALMGWAPADGEEVFDLDRFEREFRLEDISTGSPVFDLVKLDWLNGMHIRKLAPEQLQARLRDGGFLPDGADEEGITLIQPLIAERIQRLSEYRNATSWFFGDRDPISADSLVPAKSSAAKTAAGLAAVRLAFSTIEDWSPGRIETALEAVLDSVELKKPQLFMPLRMALTGRTDSPGVFEVAHILGQERSLERIDGAIGLLEEDPRR